MKLKIFSILLFSIFIFSTLVSADIISVNSGGDNGLVIVPDKYIEGFFMGGNNFPVVTNVILNSTYGTNRTYENLSVYFSSIDANFDAITNITDWRVNGNSIARLNFAFDKRIHTGSVRDYSTYLNNGNLGGGNSSKSPSWILGGKIGGAYNFDGVDDKINLVSFSNLTTSNGTIAFWTKFNTKDTPQSSFQFYENAYQDYLRSYVDSVNRMDLVIEDGDATKVNVYYDLDDLGSYVGQWIHVAWVQDGVSVKLYINGEQKTLSGTNSGSWWMNHLNLNTGLIGASSWGYLNGSLDEFQMYSRALSPQQINALYFAGVANHNLESIVSQETEIGETWQVALTPNDMFDDGLTVLSNELTIVDAGPEDPTNVVLTSLDGSNESDVDLNCSAYIIDLDTNQITVYVNWIKDGISQYNYSFANQNNATTFYTLLNNNNLTLGDVWKCSVKSGDGTTNSSWVDSNELTIIDITNPEIIILSPNATFAYDFLDLDFNISVSDNENISMCFYSINETTNISMIEINDSFFWQESNQVIPGTHNVTFYCNDTSGNWGMNYTNFTILDEAAISIALSPALSWNVNWSLASLPADDLDAIGNNFDEATTYYVNISAIGINVDLYVKADGDLITIDLDTLGLGNETYVVNNTNSSVPDLNRLTMSTGYVLIGENLPDASTAYMKFYLDAPVSQPAGIYLNNLDFKAVSYGNSP